MVGRAYEIVVVDDDSRDGTIALCAGCQACYPVRCITRAARIDGLGGAVLIGLRAATGDLLVLIDADLQHPPVRFPAIIEPIERGDAEFTVGSRTVAGGSNSSAWPLHRRLTSWTAKMLARPFAGELTDVMDYFALPRAVFERGERGARLAPLGFKIGPEMIC